MDPVVYLKPPVWDFGVGPGYETEVKRKSLGDILFLKYWT